MSFKHTFEAAEKTGVPRSTIDRKINNNRTINNLIFKYVKYE